MIRCSNLLITKQTQSHYNNQTTKKKKSGCIVASQNHSIIINKSDLSVT